MWSAVGNIGGQIMGMGSAIGAAGGGGFSDIKSLDQDQKDLLYGNQSMMAMNAFGIGNNPLD